MYNCTNKWRITRKTNFSGESGKTYQGSANTHFLSINTYRDETGMRRTTNKIYAIDLFSRFDYETKTEPKSGSLSFCPVTYTRKPSKTWPTWSGLGGGKVSRDNQTSQPSHKEKLEHSRWQIATLALCENQWDFLFRIHYDHHYAHLDLWSFGACSLVHLLNFLKEQAPPHTSHEGFSPQELP